jgi:hypothetical protein
MLQPDEFAVQVIDYCPTLEGDELLVVCEVAEQVSLLAREHAFGCASQRNSKIVVTGIQRSYRSFDLPCCCLCSGQAQSWLTSAHRAYRWLRRESTNDPAYRADHAIGVPSDVAAVKARIGAMWRA